MKVFKFSTHLDEYQGAWPLARAITFVTSGCTVLHCHQLNERPCCFTSSPALVVVSVLDLSHSGRACWGPERRRERDEGAEHKGPHFLEFHMHESMYQRFFFFILDFFTQHACSKVHAHSLSVVPSSRCQMAFHCIGTPLLLPPLTH